MEGFEIHEPRRQKKPIPEWIKSKESFRKVIYSHPQAKKYAARWTAVAYWYWLCQMPASEIAENLRLSKKMVEWTVYCLKKRANTMYPSV